MTISASTRISIRWPPEPASEPTDTLVISVNGYYVDLRVLKSDHSIDWALAGERIVISEDPLQVKFTHPLDSHLPPTIHPNNENDLGKEDEPEPEPEPDIGSFTLLPNNDKLETGEMAAPHLNGQIMPYEEVWRSIDYSMDMNSNSESISGSDNGDGSGGGVGIPFAFVIESIHESVDEEAGIRKSYEKSYYARAGRLFIGIRRRVDMVGMNGDGNNDHDDDGKESKDTITRPKRVVFDAIRHEYDLVEGQWVVKYSIGRTEDMWSMNAEWINKLQSSGKKWEMGDEVSIEGNGLFIVRAAAAADSKSS